MAYRAARGTFANDLNSLLASAHEVGKREAVRPKHPR